MNLLRSQTRSAFTPVTTQVHHGELRAAWTTDPAAGASARIETRPAGPLLLLSLGATPSRGWIRAQDHGGCGFRGLLFQSSGRQRIVDQRMGERVLLPGEALLWGDQDAGSFEASEALQELQILVPGRDFERLWPSLAADDGPRHLGSGALVTAAHAGLQALWRQRNGLAEDELHSALIALIDLIAKVAPPTAPSTPRARMLDGILRHIDLQLDDPELAPATIAQRHGCSVRTLHALFAERGETVAGWIRRRRLERCRERLCQGENEQRIADIALQWGFADPAHFSKVFKAAYGLSPRHYRQRRGTIAFKQ